MRFCFLTDERTDAFLFFASRAAVRDSVTPCACCAVCRVSSAGGHTIGALSGHGSDQQARPGIVMDYNRSHRARQDRLRHRWVVCRPGADQTPARPCASLAALGVVVLIRCATSRAWTAAIRTKTDQRCFSDEEEAAAVVIRDVILRSAWLRKAGETDDLHISAQRPPPGTA